jgi:hypothetical protein
MAHHRFTNSLAAQAHVYVHRLQLGDPTAAVGDVGQACYLHRANDIAVHLSDKEPGIDVAATASNARWQPSGQGGA